MIHEKHWLIYLPEESTIASELNELGNIYNELDTECSTWQQVSPYFCPSGCGTCCTHFIPDVLPIEADYAASYLVLHWEKYKLRIDTVRPAPGCPFYEPDKAEHCTIYTVRPLICRLFAWSALTNKKGELDYKPCHHMKKKELDSLSETSASRQAPPLMTIFSHRVASLQPSYAGERVLLPEQLLTAIQRINYMRQLYGSKD